MSSVAIKSQALGDIMVRIKRAISTDGIAGPHVLDLVATFNALSLPKGYVYIDPDGLIHYVRIVASLLDSRKERTLPPTQVQYTADVIWCFDAIDGTWTVIKDRTGDFEKLAPIKCGGMKGSVG